MIQRVLVTGGSGFLGSYIVRALIKRGLKVAVLLRGRKLPERLQGLEKELSLIQGDLALKDSWIKAAETFAPEAIIHMAWLGVAGNAKNDATQTDNISMTLDLTAAAKSIGVEHFIAAGSQAEYGPINRLCNEEDPTEPTTLYGQAKLTTGRMTGAYCAENKMRFAWLRVFSTYGPSDHDYWLIPYLIEEMLAGRSPQLTGCEQRWDFLHARDAAEAITSVLLQEDAGGVFNLGSGEAPPLISTVHILRELINPSLALGIGAIPYRPDQVMHLQADISRLTNFTGWKPKISLPEGLRETVAWHVTKHKG